MIVDNEGTSNTNYFVSNIFVEKIFDDISRRQDANREMILRQITRMEEQVLVVMDIKLVDIPNVEERFDMTTRRTILLAKQVVNQKADDALT